MYPAYPGSGRSRNFRLVGLAILFVGVLSSALFAFIYFQRSDFKLSTMFPMVKQKVPDPDPLFYRSIGAFSETSSASEKNTIPQQQVFTLQIAVLPTKNDAEKIMQKLRHKQIETYYSAYRREGKVEYRVRRGVFTTKKNAHLAAQELRKKHDVAVEVTPLD